MVREENKIFRNEKQQWNDHRRPRLRKEGASMPVTVEDVTQKVYGIHGLDINFTIRCNQSFF